MTQPVFRAYKGRTSFFSYYRMWEEDWRDCKFRCATESPLSDATVRLCYR